MPENKSPHHINHHCCFSPPELIESFGLKTTRFIAPGTQTSESGGELHPGICSWCKSLLGSAKKGYHIGSCTCDQMSRSLDILGMRDGFFTTLFHMPATRTDSTFRLYKKELEYLKQKLEKISGKRFDPDALKAQIKIKNNLRKSIREFRDVLSGSELSRVIQEMMKGKLTNFQTKKTSLNSKIKIAIVGSPTSKAEISWLKMIEKFGVEIVFDATCTGDRFVELDIDENIDPFEALAAGYFYQIPCIRARPNTELFDWMKTRIFERGVQGVIWKNVRGCDLWNAEIPVARELLGVPILGLDITYSDVGSPRTMTRVEAFLEGL